MMLIHSASGQALCKDWTGDCPPNLVGPVTDDTADEMKDASHSRNYAWKLEVIKKDRVGKPSELYIRNDHHPQRCLKVCDGNLMLVDTWSSCDELVWLVEYHELKNDEGEMCGKLVSFKNKQNGQYLTVMKDQLDLGTLDTWIMSPMSWTAWTPGGAAGVSLGCAFAVAATAVTAGLAGSAIAAGSTASVAGAEAAAAGASVVTAVEAVGVASAPITIAAGGAAGSTTWCGAVLGMGQTAIAASGSTGAVAGACGELATAVAAFAPLASAAATASAAAAHATVLCATVGAGSGIIAAVSASLAVTVAIDSSDPSLYVMKC